jgi:hypothetical protein
MFGVSRRCVVFAAFEKKLTSNNFSAYFELRSVARLIE